MCKGIYVWYSCSNGAVLHCSWCGKITTTGNWNDPEHAQVPVVLEGY